MPSQRSAASAIGKRKATADMSSDEDHRLSTTSSKSKKRQKVNTSIATRSNADKKLQKDKAIRNPTTTVIIELPTKALDDILKKGVAQAPQKSIRDIIYMIHAQKALITSQAPVSDEFTVIVRRENREWSGHFRVRKVHRLYELAKVVATASGVDVQGMSFDIPVANSSNSRLYSMGDAEDADRTLREASLLHGFQSWQ